MVGLFRMLDLVDVVNQDGSGWSASMRPENPCSRNTELHAVAVRPIGIGRERIGVEGR